jgi:hypothetical protein
MFTLIVVLTSAFYIAAIYYAFTAHSLTKAFAIVSGSTTLVACAIVGFIKIDLKTLARQLDPTRQRACLITAHCAAH